MSRLDPQRALVLAPHPDDESLGCGGAIKLITAAGGQVDVVCLTHGEFGRLTGMRADGPCLDELARIRADEAVRAGAVLGIANVSFLKGRDRRLAEMVPERAEEILRLLDQGDYRSVFAPWARDGHPDHVATHQTLVAALKRYARPIEVWLYEVWSPLEPNMAIPIDTVIEDKVRAIRAYESQLTVHDYESTFRALAQYRSLLCPGTRYAEAFFVCKAATLCSSQPSEISNLKSEI